MGLENLTIVNLLLIGVVVYAIKRLKDKNNLRWK
jgi:hypothetical protein